MSAPSAQLDPQAEVDSAVPPCPHFGPCGGCQLQDLAYAAQLRRKAAQLRALLPAPLPEIQVHSSPPLAYRNRIRLTLAEVDGQLRAGYLTQIVPLHRDPRPAASFLPITQCPIAAPILWRAAEAFLALVNQSESDAKSKSGAAADLLLNLQYTPDQLELFATADESRLQLSLYLRARSSGAARLSPAKLAAAFTTLCDSLRARLPELTGAGIFLLPPHSAQRSRRAEQPRPGPTWGSPGLNYIVAQSASNSQPASGNPPTSYWIPRGAFFQVNRFLLPGLLSLVAAQRSGQLAWDLYAGVGLFSRALAAGFAQVTAVEIAEPAASALASTGLANLRAVKATTLNFLRAAVIERDRPDLVVLDPPRSGAGREVCELLGRVAASTLVYVSCAPEVLPADLVTLAAAGYAVRELHLFDLFPQTVHIETVAILTRDAPATPHSHPISPGEV